MSSVEQRARNRLADAYDLRGWKDEANALRSGMPMDSPTVAALDTIAAALREQPEERGVVDGAVAGLRVLRTILAKENLAGVDVADQLIADLTAAQQPVQAVMPDLWRARNVRANPYGKWHGGGWREVLTVERDGFQTCCPFLTDRMNRPAEYEVEFAWKGTAPPSAPVGVERGAWTDDDMQKPWGAESAFLRHLASDPALNLEQSAMLRHCAKRIESTAGIHLRALADMLDPAKQAGVLRDAVDALAQQPAQAAPGWKLVPVEPTDAMLEAGFDGAYPPGGNEDSTADIASAYAAMLAAAPTPPGDDAAGVECERCHGSGTITASAGSGPDQYDADAECPTCGGTGAFQ